MKENKETLLRTVKFTKRQLQVIHLWSELPNELVIGEQLEVSHHSVHTHLRRLREKLGVKRTFDVYKYVIKVGLLPAT